MDITRAWRDADYRAALSPAQRAALPANPAGAVELDDQELADLAGGTGSVCALTVSVCVTGVAGCWTLNNTVCNGTCGWSGTKGCCG
ncbi:mersacidin/lichenicidin family type 2 lantibiotic [Streptomyces flavofungini]|uniref:mersacidin/lichenicidin family type 2 lantibiotic n=1 Tax=Streptomyces flavofungini TaxID=68200 RepID=UPI0034DE4EB6